MLHCADCTFYVGHTDDLEARVAQHELGTIPGYTSTRRPVKLVWSEHFATREEARQAEQRLKGWRQAKKLALIRGDWELISALAQGKKGALRLPPAAAGSGQASTSSAKPVSMFLHPHPNHLPSEPFALEVTINPTGEHLRLHYRLTGDLQLVLVPSPNAPGRQEELWRHTCFEAFIRSGSGDGYLEYNFSPSTRWAAYRFPAHRAGMEPLDCEPPRISSRPDRYALDVKAKLLLPDRRSQLFLNLAAVIEEKSGAKSYWALAHPPEGPPDFHHPACFVLELPPAPAP